MSVRTDNSFSEIIFIIEVFPSRCSFHRVDSNIDCCYDVQIFFKRFQRWPDLVCDEKADLRKRKTRAIIVCLKPAKQNQRPNLLELQNEIDLHPQAKWQHVKQKFSSKTAAPESNHHNAVQETIRTTINYD